MCHEITFWQISGEYFCHILEEWFSLYSGFLHETTQLAETCPNVVIGCVVREKGRMLGKTIIWWREIRNSYYVFRYWVSLSQMPWLNVAKITQLQLSVLLGCLRSFLIVWMWAMSVMAKGRENWTWSHIGTKTFKSNCFDHFVNSNLILLPPKNFVDQFSLHKHYTKILKTAIWQIWSKLLCDDLKKIVVKLSQMMRYREVGYPCNVSIWGSVVSI